MLFQIDIKRCGEYLYSVTGLRVMLFQIDIKLLLLTYFLAFAFESNVILDRYKTNQLYLLKTMMFESNVILDRYKTRKFEELTEKEFESNVILDRYKT